ncbi:MAG: DUF2723 domain-containing protein [Flavobacteriales bacterium]|nr:MAG: DUF2723 domain-containing protein [Flavobacteriales bacterium]
MQFKRINIITGWLVWLVATYVYVATIEPTASFWDCGEFLATANKLEVGHPPGAPLFMMIARIFSAFASPEDVPMTINILSALCSSFTILFLFWTITHLAYKLAVRKGDEDWSTGKLIAVMGSGIVGALAYTFSDSFWFSAVEAEVYSMSSLFTAAVFWAILKWESEADQPHHTRWLILICYLLGLSIGVQLLGLLVIPCIVLVYYFRRYTPTWKGFLITMLIGAVILGAIQAIIIPGVAKVAGWFELRFVNDFGLPFNTGNIVYGVLVVGLIVWGLWFTQKRGRVVANTIILGISVILLGYTSYAMTVVRSHANPPIDENNPENVFNLVSYLNREQYGDRPLLFGQFWESPMAPQNRWGDGTPVRTATWLVKKGTRTVKRFYDGWSADHYLQENPGLTVEHVYEVTDERKNSEPAYEQEFTMFFPRMYSPSGNHVGDYRSWADFPDMEELEAKLAEAKASGNRELIEHARERIADMQANGVRFRDPRTEETRMIYKPGQGENVRFFMDYQVNWMYWRYFLWNFAGRQNDIQGTSGGITEGNWLSGLDFVDEQRLGEQSTLPSSMKNNKAYNKLFFLPLILGLIGLVYQLTRNIRDWTVVLLLFFFTGLAIVIYLNQTPMQPRERDYAYVGSFYAFAIWIGLGVYALFDAARTIKRMELLYAVGAGLALVVLKYLAESVTGGDHSGSYSLLWITGVGGGAALLFHGMGMVMKNDTVVATLATLLCVLVPLQMLSVEWDDHNRAKRMPARDVASNYLNSCAPNAILFTNGDNDTFPLWYAQEVEGIRTDVRVVNLSLLNTDWYIDQMRRKAYESDPVPFKMAPEKYRQGTRDAVYLLPRDRKNPQTMDLRKAMAFVANDDNMQGQGGDKYAYFPTNRFSVPVDSAKVITNGTVSVADSARIADAMVWTVGKQALYKNHLMVLDLLANNNWERPVYFAVTTGPDSYINMQEWFRLEGLTYRVVPIQHRNTTPGQYGHVGTDIMLKNLDLFRWGNMDTEDPIYLDENILRMTMNMRMQMSALADALTTEGRKAEAIKVLDMAFEHMPERNVPYDRVILPLIEGYYDAGAADKANKLAERLFAIMDENMQWQLSLDQSHYDQLGQETMITRAVMDRLVDNVERFGNDAALLEKLKARMTEVNADYNVKNGLPANLDLNQQQQAPRPTSKIKL